MEPSSTTWMHSALRMRKKEVKNDFKKEAPQKSQQHVSIIIQHHSSMGAAPCVPNRAVLRATAPLGKEPHANATTGILAVLPRS